MFDWQGAYCGPASGAGDWLDRWNNDPVLIAMLLVAACAMLRLPAPRQRSGLAAVAVLAIAFLSPLCALTTALFSARAVHHLLLFAVAAPLLALALQPRKVPGMGAALLIATVTLWAWHMPSLYDAALDDRMLYWMMQTALLASATLFWAAIRRATPLEAAAGIVGGAVQMGFLGAVLTFATRPLYTVHLATTASFGIGPLADQQLAGLVMWVPGMLPFAVAGGWLAQRRWRRMTLALPGLAA